MASTPWSKQQLVQPCKLVHASPLTDACGVTLKTRREVQGATLLEVLMQSFLTVGTRSCHSGLHVHSFKVYQ